MTLVRLVVQQLAFRTVPSFLSLMPSQVLHQIPGGPVSFAAIRALQTFLCTHATVVLLGSVVAKAFGSWLALQSPDRCLSGVVPLISLAICFSSFGLLPWRDLAARMGSALVPLQLPLPLEGFAAVGTLVAFHFVVDALVVLQGHEVGVSLAAQGTGEVPDLVALLVVEQAACVAVRAPALPTSVRTLFGIWKLLSGDRKDRERLCLASSLGPKGPLDRVESRLQPPVPMHTLVAGQLLLEPECLGALGTSVAFGFKVGAIVVFEGH